MLFADNIFLAGESREKKNWKLDIWSQVLEARDFRLSKSKQNICNVS